MCICTQKVSRYSPRVCSIKDKECVFNVLGNGIYNKQYRRDNSPKKDPFKKTPWSQISFYLIKMGSTVSSCGVLYHYICITWRRDKCDPCRQHKNECYIKSIKWGEDLLMRLIWPKWFIPQFSNFKKFVIIFFFYQLRFHWFLESVLEQMAFVEDGCRWYLISLK